MSYKNLRSAGQDVGLNRYISKQRKFTVMTKRKHFAKILSALLALSLILCSLFTLTACTGYEGELEKDDTKSLCFGYNKRKNDAFISEYHWHGHLGEDMDIVLPNTYKGAPVTALGGYVGIGAPNPFMLDFFEESDLEKELFGEVDNIHGDNVALDINTQDEVCDSVKADFEYYHITKEFEVVDIVFNLHIGSNLQKIDIGHWGGVKHFVYANNEADENVTVYALSFVAIVDEQNEYFYSDDLGRMYYKENNKLVNYFLYHNRETFPERSLPQN